MGNIFCKECMDVEDDKKISNLVYKRRKDRFSTSEGPPIIIRDSKLLNI